MVNKNYDLDLMLVVIRRNSGNMCEVWRWLASSSKRSSNVHVETCIHCTSQKNREQVVTDQKQEVLDMDAFWPAGQNVDNIPKAVLKKSVKTMVLHACVAKAQRSFLRKRVLRMSPFHQNHAVKDTMTFAKNISLMKEQLKVASDLASVSSTKTIEIVAETCNIQSLDVAVMNQSTCQYMGWNTDLCRFW
jgi:hypothetical protein